MSFYKNKTTQAFLGFLLYIANSYSLGLVTFKQPVVGMHEMRPEVGLYVSEKLNNSTNYVSWTGTCYNSWFTSYHHAMFKVAPRLELGFGPAYESTQKYRHDVRIEGVMQWQLWK